MPDGNKLAERLLGHAYHPLLPADVRETLRQLGQWVLDVELSLHRAHTDRHKIWQRIERDELPKENASGAPHKMPSL